MREEPYTTGEIVKLRPYGRGDSVTINAPSGLVLTAKVDESGSFPLWLATAGEWVVTWPNGDTEVYLVADQVAEPEELELIDHPLTSHPTPFRTKNA